jgi:hypothetical protein
MNKQRFAEIFLSRFLAMEVEAQTDFGILLVHVSEELGDDVAGETEEFKEWAQTICEMLFPESIGDVILKS